MVFVALISWIMTVCAGLYLLAIWLIEYDVSAPGGAVTRLPRTVAQRSRGCWPLRAWWCGSAT